MSKDFTLYYAALSADEAWHNALVARYGARKAGDARYTSAGVETPKLLALCKAKKAADIAWLIDGTADHTTKACLEVKLEKLGVA